MPDNIFSEFHLVYPLLRRAENFSSDNFVKEIVENKRYLQPKIMWLLCHLHNLDLLKAVIKIVGITAELVEALAKVYEPKEYTNLCTVNHGPIFRETGYLYVSNSGEYYGYLDGGYTLSGVLQTAN